MLSCIDFRRCLRELAHLIKRAGNSKLSEEEVDIGVYNLKKIDHDFLRRTSSEIERKRSES